MREKNPSLVVKVGDIVPLYFSVLGETEYGAEA
jgi:hypothetical protein